MEPQINFIAIAVAALFPMIIGFIYYHPKVLGQHWMNANGFTLESLGNGPKPILYGVLLITSFLLAFFLWANVTGFGGIDQSQVKDAVTGKSYVTFQHGLAHGLIFGITVLLPIFASMATFERRGFKWFWVNWLYWYITTSLMLGLLSAWR